MSQIAYARANSERYFAGMRRVACAARFASMVLSFLLLLTASVRAAAEQPLKVQLLWTHQAQFAGYYIAEAHAHHEHEATEIELIEGGPGIDPFERLSKGEVDVTIGWLAHALEARIQGADIVNVAQIFRRSGMALACNKAAGIRRISDIAGRSIGVWNLGDEISVRQLLQQSGVAPSSIQWVPQEPDGKDLISGKLPCATVMIYNEHWSLLAAGLKPTDLLLVRFADAGVGMLEDGLYVRRSQLEDPRFRQRLAGLLGEVEAGWRQARENPDEAVAFTLAKAPRLDATHQRRMLESILSLMPSDSPFGLLDLGDFERTVEILASGTENPTKLRQEAKADWTHRIWYEAGLDGNQPFTEATRHYLVKAMESPWFYVLDLVGTVAFGLAGFMRARQRQYDLWGAFVLTFLPAVGGGTLRDLLIGGKAQPFILKDPSYMCAVFAVWGVGTVLSRLLPPKLIEPRHFERFLAILDTVGVAVFTLVGAKVALISNLAWYWVPICAALTCAGGGMLLDVVTGREPRTFQGEPYEEIAVFGGLLLYFLLLAANHYEHSPWIVTVSLLLTLIAVYVTRMLVIVYGIRSYRLGGDRTEAR